MSCQSRFQLFKFQHSAYDGMATMDPCVFALMEISKQKPPMTAHLPEPCILPVDEWLENNKDCVQELAFELTTEVQKAIFDAKTNLSKKIDNLYLELKSFDDYGKSTIKEMKIHPDTFMQIAIQVAGYRTKERSVRIDLRR